MRVETHLYIQISRSVTTLGLILILFPPAFSVQQLSAAGKHQPIFRPTATPRSNRKDTDRIAQLELLIPRLMREGDVPGLSVVLIRDGRVFWHKAFGVKNADSQEPIDDNTIFEAASLGKPVLAYAVLKLVDSGKLDLDQPLSSYLPSPYLQADERVKLITARMVLSHTTGFQNEVIPGLPLKLYFRPGEKFSYSGEGYLYLQNVVEHLTNEPFESFMRKMVFEPLNMTSSNYLWQDRYEKLKASGHNSAGVAAVRRKPTLARASTLHTTVLDFSKFVIAIMQRRGLKTETSKEMLTTQVRVEEGCYFCIERNAGALSESLSWGLGWGLEKSETGDAAWHWGENNGEFQNFVMIYPREKLGIVIFSNSNNGLSITPEIVSRALGSSHPAFAWMGYEPYDSPGKLLLRDILARGPAAINQYRETRGQPNAKTLNEVEVNNLGYRLLGKKRINEAIEVFKLNVEDFPNSANTYDSLGEAYLISGNSELAVKNYQKSLELNPDNKNAVEVLKRLQTK